MAKNSKEHGKAPCSPTIGARICKSLDIPPDLLPKGTLIEIRGRSSLTLTGGGRILEYTPNEIRIAVKGGAVCVRGGSLQCTSYHVGAISIDGMIVSVCFEEGER